MEAWNLKDDLQARRKIFWNKVTKQVLEPERLWLARQSDRNWETWGSWSRNFTDASDCASKSWFVVNVCREERKVPVLQDAHVALIMELHAGILAGFFSAFVCGVLFFFSFNLGHYTKINCQKTLLKLQFPLAQESVTQISVTWGSMAPYIWNYSVPIQVDW